MAKMKASPKPKKTKRKPRPATHMMVIRVAVPARYAPDMKVANVIGIHPRLRFSHSLEVLSAYYDMPKQPNARS